MSGVVFAYAAIEMVGVAAGEMENSDTGGPEGGQRGHLPDRRLLLRLDPAAGLHAARPPSTRRAPARSSPSSTGWAWPGWPPLIQAILIVAAMSSLNSGLYSTGRVLRSLGMSKQAPAFTLKMSSSGRAVGRHRDDLGRLRLRCGAQLPSIPDAFEIALEAAAHRCRLHLGHDLRLPAAAPEAGQPRGDPEEHVPGARVSVDQLHRARLSSSWSSSGWRSRAGSPRPYFWHKTDFIVVVFGIPIIAIVLLDRLAGRAAARWWPTPAAGSRRCGRTTGPTYGRARSTRTS